jgi:hypothetical protein
MDYRLIIINDGKAANAYEQHAITYQQYETIHDQLVMYSWGGALATLGASLVGGFYLGTGVKALLADSAAFAVANQTVDMVGSNMMYQVSGGRVGQIIDLSNFSGERFVMDTAMGMGVGWIGSKVFSSLKYKFKYSVDGSLLPTTMVKPIAQDVDDIFKNSLVDSGYNLFANSGGKIFIKSINKEIYLPKASEFIPRQAFDWVVENAPSFKSLINRSASLREQAVNAIKLYNDLLMVARNSIYDEEIKFSLNVLRPLETVEQLITRYGKEYSGDKMYQKIIDDLFDTTNLQKMMALTEPPYCFAAGTLVHTDKGLVPIEQVKVGDMVLSRHESGEGELAYKRVTKTFITENQPIWAMDIGGPFGLKEDEDDYIKREFLFTTANHPFWTFERKSRYEIDIFTGKWVSASNMEPGEALFSYNGKFVDIVENLPLYQTTEPDKAFYKVYPDYFSGIFLDINSYKYHQLQVPSYIEDEPPGVFNWDESEDDIIRDEYETTVYNFEVENYHTYFVGELGVWVHNTCNPWAEFEYAKDAGVRFIYDNGFSIKPDAKVYNIGQAKD